MMFALISISSQTKKVSWQEVVCAFVVTLGSKREMCDQDVKRMESNGRVLARLTLFGR